MAALEAASEGCCVYCEANSVLWDTVKACVVLHLQPSSDVELCIAVPQRQAVLRCCVWISCNALDAVHNACCKHDVNLLQGKCS